MLDDIFTLIISFSLGCLEVALFIFIAVMCGTIITPCFWSALLVYITLRNAYVLHIYARWC